MKEQADEQLIGTPVKFWGQTWIITAINRYGMYHIDRFDCARRVWQRSAMGPEQFPEDHPQHWTIPAPAMKGRFAKCIANANKFAPIWCYFPPSLSSRKYRRYRCYRNQLKRFFARMQKPRQLAHSYREKSQ